MSLRNVRLASRMGCLTMVLCGLSASATATAAGQTRALVGEMRVEPAKMTLVHRRWPHSIVVSGTSAHGQSIDLTSQATFRSADPDVATVDLMGWVQPVGSGTAHITVSAAGQTAQVAVDVQLPDEPRPFSFRKDIMPVLSKGGCNMGACHGYSLGKNGFKLSLRGSDPEYDYGALTDEFLERRVNRHNPPASLILMKPLGDVPHEGGVRFDAGSLSHDDLLGWISEGARGGLDDPVRVESVQISPEKVVLGPGQQHQLQLTAHYTDGSHRDVTRLGIYNVNTERVAEVTDSGLVTSLELGETAVVARFERLFATTNLIVLDPAPDFTPTPVPEDNLVDTHVVRKLNDLNIKPSALVDDAGFLRRVFLDLTGVQPTPDEVRAFLADTSPDKRVKVVDRLLERPEFVDWWSLKWGDLLQNSRTKLSEPAVFAFREWIRAAVASNMPLDEFARRILTASGSYTDDPASAYYAVSGDAHDSLQRATQVFCGVRMLCAKCHPHPFENWTQGDYYGLHSFFNQVTTKNDPRLTGVKNAKVALVNLSAGYSRNPRSGQLQPPRYLGGEEPQVPDGVDRRKVYAEWLTSAGNPFFARSLANRIWSYFFHRGIIDPVDDLRTTNPPINPALLDALARDFADHKFDVRHLMRRIVTSRTYQRSSVPNETNAHDNLNFSRAVPRRLPAEALLDSLVQATGVPERFRGAPAGFTAAQLPDAEVRSDFLDLFGKPRRLEACECERDDGSNMLQALHLINGKSIMNRVTAGNGRVARLVKEHSDNARLIEELYLWSLARLPDQQETDVAAKFLSSSANRTEGAQDLMWALLNSRDFLLVH